MHESRKVFLLDREPRCILAAYEAVEGAPTKEFKTFDEDIQVDDYIVVPTDTRHNMTVCKVREVDVEPDLESNEGVAWVIARIDREGYERALQSEQKFIDAVRVAERRRKKAQLREDFVSEIDMKALPAE